MTTEETSEMDVELGLQVLSMCFTRPGAIDVFRERIQPRDLLPAGKGAEQLLQALYDFHAATQVSKNDAVDQKTFRRWLKGETGVYEAIGGEDGLDAFFERLPDDTGEKLEAIAGYVRHRGRMRRRKEVAEQVQNLAKSDMLNEETRAQFSASLEDLRKLSAMSGDPMSQVETGLDLLNEDVEALWELPNFLPTQFKGLNKAMGYDEDTGGFCKGAVHAILAQSGRGKPLWVETKVQMADGTLKPLGDIVVGDRVITRDGTARDVTEIHEQGVLDTLKITLASGRVIYSAYDHGFLTEHGWCEAENLQVGEPLLMPEYIDVEPNTHRDVSEFKKAAEQVNQIGIPDWVMSGYDAQIQVYVGEVFRRFGRFLAARYSTVPKVTFDGIQFVKTRERLQTLLARLGLLFEVNDQDQVLCTDPPSADEFRKIIPLDGRNQTMATGWTPKDDGILQRKGRYLRDEIVDITVDEPRECRCITVKQNHSFLAEGVIVHNSTFAKSLMNHWVDQGQTVLFYNFEEAKDHWKRVLFSQITKQNVYKSRNLSSEEKKKYSEVYKETMRKWQDRFIVKHDPDSPFYEDMEEQVRSMYDAGMNIDVLIIDTIQSMFLRSGKGGARWMQYEEMMVHLEKLAKDLEIVIVLTAQENRNRMQDRRALVQQSDAGGSLTIVQKCAVTIFITDMVDSGEEDLMGGTLNEGLMQLQMPKNRITGMEYVLDAPIVQYTDEYKLYEEPTNPIIPSGNRSKVNANEMDDLTNELTDFALESMNE